MKIAISGAGVAGPALAYWLHRTGHTPTLIERAPQFRTGGYVIDFWGLGYRVMQRMGIETAIRDAGYQMRELRLVGREGRIEASVGVDALRRATEGNYTSITRGDLAAAIYGTIENDVEAIFGTSITAIDEHPHGAGRIRHHAGTRVRSRDRRRWIAFHRTRFDVRARVALRALPRLHGRRLRR